MGTDKIAMYQRGMWLFMGIAAAGAAVSAVLYRKFAIRMIMKLWYRRKKKRVCSPKREEETRLLKTVALCCLFSGLLFGRTLLQADAEEWETDRTSEAIVTEVLYEHPSAQWEGIYYYGKWDGEKAQAAPCVRLTMKEAEQCTEVEILWKHKEEQEEQKLILTGSAVPKAGEYGMRWETEEETGVCTVYIMLPFCGNERTEADGRYEIRLFQEEILCFASAPIIVDKCCPCVTVSCLQRAYGIYEETEYYYHDEEVVFDFSIEEEHAPKSWKVCGKRNGQETELEIDSDSVILRLQEEGSYADFFIEGTDLAGNPLVFRKEEQEDPECMVQEVDGRIQIIGTRIVDRTPPIAKIQYTSAAKPYGYPGEEGYTAAYYYNQDIQATIQFSDRCGSDSCELDWSKLWTKCAQQGKQTAYQKVSEKTVVYEIQEQDGRYEVSVFGTDRAGNALTVYEQIPGKEEQFLETKGAEYRYQANYLLVRDTIEPEFVFSVIPDENVTNKERQEDGRYYWNGSYEVLVTVEEKNLDPEKIMLKKGSMRLTEESAASAEITEYACLEKNGYDAAEHRYRDMENRDGVYRYAVSGTDKAGNRLKRKEGQNLNLDLAEGEESVYIVVDQTPPGGVLLIQDADGTAYELHLQNGKVVQAAPYRKQTKARIRIQAEDFSPLVLSGLVEIQKKGTSDKQVRIHEAAYVRNPIWEYETEGEQVFWISKLHLCDQAGNETMITQTNRIYLDQSAPDIESICALVTSSAEMDGIPLFSREVPIRTQISDLPDSESGSGLGEISCRIFVNGIERKEEQKILKAASNTIFHETYEEPARTAMVDHILRIDAETHNFNDMEIVVEAWDQAGNRSEQHYRFGIDVTAPVIRVDYDQKEPSNGWYFKAPRRAKVTVTERNFRPDRIQIRTETDQISNWEYEKGTAENGDDDRWSTTVSFEKDGTYTLQLEGEDLLGLTAEEITYKGAAPKFFVIDRTPPVLKWNFVQEHGPVNGSYYDCVRLARFIVEDEHFAGTVDVQVQDLEKGTSSSVIFQGQQAEICMDQDGRYRIEGSVTDQAGNVSNPIVMEEFVIDRTKPQLTFYGIEDQTAYGRTQKPFAPWFTVTETNFDPEQWDVELVREDWNETEVIIEAGTWSGMTYFMKAREEIPECDGVYRWNVRVRDLAGNEENAELTFSLNRFGPVYVLGEETKELLEQYEIRIPKTLCVTAYHLSDQAYGWIDLSKDREPVKRLQPGIDYEEETIQKTETTCGWKCTHYRISESLFKEDGTYRILFYSRDMLGNAVTNEQQAEEEQNTVIEFCKDTKAPSVTLTGVEDGAAYDQAEMSCMIHYFDNQTMEWLRIELFSEGKGKKLLDRTEYNVEDGTLQEGSGTVEYPLKEQNRAQKIVITACDRAGNETEPITLTFTMSTNFWIRLLHDRQLLLESAGAAAGILFLIKIRRRQYK